MSFQRKHKRRSRNCDRLLCPFADACSPRVFDLEKVENAEYKLEGRCPKEVINQLWRINRFPKLPAGEFSLDILPPQIQHRIAMDNSGSHIYS